jgi:hypothetical protein
MKSRIGTKACLLYAAVFMFLCVVPTWAGGPLFVGSNTFGTDAKIITWDPAAMPIKYRVDGGPMSAKSTGQTVIDNSAGKTRIASMFQTWSSVTTATVSFQNAGAILATSGFSDGDVSTAAEFNAVFGSCQGAAQSPIVFDAAGGILQQLGVDPHVIGFSTQCKVSSTGFITSDMVLLNGGFLNGSGLQINNNQFDEAITHELGHLLGLDHSQINLDLLLSFNGTCSVDARAGLPLMFPIIFCPARVDSGLPRLSPDDTAWISRLYPSASFATSYATISGTIFFSDGQTPAQGVNVIARQVDNSGTTQNESLRAAVSVVSGYRFTANPGQTVTANYLPCAPLGTTNCPASGFLEANPGSQFGSRNVGVAGTFDISVPAGASYTLQVEAVYPGFTGGSSVGPLDPPFWIPGGIPEFWNTDESAFDDPTASTPIPTAPGEIINNKNIILNGTPAKFDGNEDGGAELFRDQEILWLRDQQSFATEAA